MIKTITILFLFTTSSINCYSQSGTAFKKTLPESGKFINNKPVGEGWVNLLTSKDNWNVEKKYWQWDSNILHGELNGDTVHHYCWTKKNYKDFELNVMIRMTGGDDANSGVCIRIHPSTWDDVPGYQVDMGKGYWGSLWEERRAGMVQKYPDSLAAKLVKANDWNHYYIIAKGHHIQAWLNGVKTIDIVHDAGFADGNIGFQLCHERRHTIVDVMLLYIREIK